MWQQKAEKLAETLGVDVWHPCVLAFLQGAAGDRPWVVACSGGLDSLSLLLSVYAHFPQKRQDLRVLHLNHNLRGPESDGDASFVQEVCASLQLACVVEKAEAVPLASVTEALIRQWRLDFYEKMLKQWGTSVLLQGHHGNDVVETVLMRLSRGSNVGGLASPRPVSAYQDWGYFLRPFIDVPKETLRQAMACNRIFWREDTSNASNAFYRNGVRNELLPKWNILSPAPLVPNVARTRMLLEETDVALEAWVDQEVAAVGVTRDLRLSAYAHLPRAVLRRIVYRWAEQVGCLPNLVADQVDALLQAVQEGEVLQRHLTAVVQLHLDGEGVLRLQPIAADAAAEPWLGGAIFSVGTAFSPFGQITCTGVVLTEKLLAMIESGQVDEQCECYLAWPAQQAVAALTVRAWQAGDRYVALGSTGSKKLQDCFVDKKIEQGQRSRLPVIAWGDEILWCPGLPPAQSHRISATTAYALRLTYWSN